MSGTPSRAETRHVPELDGIRGIAILLVLIVHFGDYAPTGPNPAANVARALIGFGWTGVDLFFVLSGCLITGILLDSKGSDNYFRSFYARRSLRILPLYYLSVAGYFLAFLPVAHVLGRALEIHSSEQIWYWLYASNWRIAFHPYAVMDLSHFWSLAIEEQFYLVWPFIIFVFSESTLLYLCPAIILFALGLRGLPVFQAVQTHYPEFLYTLTPFRIDALAFGAFAILLVRNRRLRVVAERWLGAAFTIGCAGLAAVVLAGRSARQSSLPMTYFGYTTIDLIYACVILDALCRAGSGGFFPRLFRNPLLMRFGKYSYAIYVIHWPVSSFVDDFFQSRITGAAGFPAALISIVAGVGISYGLGVISWNLLEKHFLRLKARFPY